MGTKILLPESASKVLVYWWAEFLLHPKGPERGKQETSADLQSGASSQMEQVPQRKIQAHRRLHVTMAATRN